MIKYTREELSDIENREEREALIVALKHLLLDAKARGVEGISMICAENALRRNKPWLEEMQTIRYKWNKMLGDYKR